MPNLGSDFNLSRYFSLQNTNSKTKFVLVSRSHSTAAMSIPKPNGVESKKRANVLGDIKHVLEPVIVDATESIQKDLKRKSPFKLSSKHLKEQQAVLAHWTKSRKLLVMGNQLMPSHDTAMANYLLDALGLEPYQAPPLQPEAQPQPETPIENKKTGRKLVRQKVAPPKPVELILSSSEEEGEKEDDSE